MNRQNFIIALLMTVVAHLSTWSASAIKELDTIGHHEQGWPAKKHLQEEEDASGCPLTLSLLNYDTHCYEGAAKSETADLYNLTMPLCCLELFFGLSKIMATYTNSSGRLFLDAPEEAACVGELANVTECRDMTGIFIAGESPCAFRSPQTLASAIDALHMRNVSLTGIVKDCGPAGGGREQEVECDECMASFNDAVALLHTAMHDQPYVCATALFLSIASTNTNNPKWTDSLYGCIHQDVSFHNLIQQGSQKVPWTIIIMIVILGLMLGAMVAVIVYMKRSRKKKSKPTYYGDKNPAAIVKGNGSYNESLDFAHSEGLYAFAAEEIMKATNYFSVENFLGEGSAGKVFKGVLPSGQFVAVKRINKDKKLHTFKAELANLSKVRHAHLVTLLGYCPSCDEYYLVYEYCSKGDLSKWLFVAQDDTEYFLSWEERVRIAVNSARGLWFLHYYPGGSIIHRDIKPTNILLNEHMEAKLSDFGLARYIALEESHVFTEVKGTAGYLDPEYMTMGELTKASDVYSFGIVLLQLISGRRAIDLDPRHRLSLIKTAKLISETGEDLREFADPRLQGQYSEMAMLKMFRVAIMCIASSRHERLTMKEVLQNLEDVSHLSLYTMPAGPVADQAEYEHTTSPARSLSSGSP